MARKIKVGDRVHIPYNSEWEGKIPRWIGIVEEIIQHDDGYRIQARQLNGATIRYVPAQHCKWVAPDTEK